MKINVYTLGNENMPSSRLRWINYKKNFKDMGIDISTYPISNYIYKRFFLKKEIEYADISVVQKAIVSKKILKKIKKKSGMLLYDIDDAIWLDHPIEKNNNSLFYKIKKKINRIIFNNSLNSFDKIIVSNNYIKQYIFNYNNNVEIIPTAASDSQIESINNNFSFLKKKFIVGWSGTKNNLIYLKEIEPYIKKFFLENNDAYLLIVSDSEYLSDDPLFNKKIINIKWDINTENYLIRCFDIGIMPLRMDEWSLGKAAYKLIYYMKYGIPNIATDWGFQQEFIENNQNGILVANNFDWYKSLDLLYNNKSLREQINKNAKKTYNLLFHKNVIFEKYLKAMGLKNQL